MDRPKVQLYVVLAILILWAVSLFFAALDGNTMAKLITPMATMAFGWLFAEHASSG